MRVAAVRSWAVRTPLTRPYAIAGGSWDAAEMVFVAVTTGDGLVGYGQASPAEEVTGETAAASARELAAERLGWLVGQSPVAARDRLPHELSGPAARAAVDMALWDLEARGRGVTLVDLLGRAQTPLPTSVTIGVKPVDETLAEADEYTSRGLWHLKVKTGVDVDLDLERLARLRERFGAALTLRVDANQGYDERSLARFVARMAPLVIELVEQPLPPALDAALLSFPAAVRRSFVADESVHSALDLARLAALGGSHGHPFGAINVKLMKCGGPTPALALARAAERLGLGLMWGCMDESVLGIAAALHTAYACRGTRFLDLDGSLDLAEDPFRGGFELLATGTAAAPAREVLATLAAPGLGCELHGEATEPR